ncbi:MAG: hypothetical protein K2G64_02985 [Muribaculaceae bacterium]|nr:hypothetical protein [Muribaculaceae bacterium]MDE5968049.1 hypothetical protein [Muribaculaceae bacterium]MDE7393083.1 hypothetical protein [Muribaculaceae bacterium]
MGNGRIYPDSGFTGSAAKYERIDQYQYANGLRGSIIKRKDDVLNHSNLPQFSNTSDLYFRQNANGVCQARVYVDHATFLDFDWSHNHANKADGRNFQRGTIHVQTWLRNSDGSFTRLSDDARMMNNFEMKKYGPLIKKFCKEVKFR